MYKVLVRFNDLTDNGHTYNVGDTYPRSGASVSDDRLLELSTTNNKRGIVLIEKIKDKKEKIEKEEEPERAPKPKKKK